MDEARKIIAGFVCADMCQRDCCADRREKEVNRFFAALHSSGLKVLPREPTKEMVSAGDELCSIARGSESFKLGGGIIPEDYWRAMFDAAPPLTTRWTDNEGTEVLAALPATQGGER